MTHTWKRLVEEEQKNIKEIETVLFQNRGIKTEKEREHYINPPHPEHISLSDLDIDKESIKKAITRIRKAKNEKESVVIYTDYDVDGVCGGAILWEGLFEEGLRVMPYVPDRVTEGYGLSIKGIDNAKKQHNPNLIITIDNGIKAEKEIAYAKKLGIDVIVIDHHEKGKYLDATVIHTTKLCATGVAWYFIREVVAKKKLKNENLDLAAIATVADCVSLIGPNRSLVKYGLEELKKTKRVGLDALIKGGGVEKDKIGVFEIGYILAPRINAMGRIAHALDSLRLICTKDPLRAELLASQMSKTNKERQNITEVSLDEILAQAKKIEKQKIITISGDFNQGVIGLLAGKLVEKYHKPAIVISIGETFCKGSMRSVPGLNITQFLQSFTEVFENIGGHPMAGGFTIRKENIEKLEKKIQEKAETIVQNGTITKELVIDCPIDINIINGDLLKVIQNLAPYGIGNPEPVFESKNMKVNTKRKIGLNGKHLKLSLYTQSNLIDAVAFGLGEKHDEIKENLHAAYKVEENVWNGRRSLQINIKDVIIN